MTGIKSYSTSAVADDEYFPENQSPGSVNNGARQLKTDLREWYNDPSWIEYGVGNGSSNGGTDYTITYVSSTQFRVATGDVTGAYHAGRKVRATMPITGTIHGTLVTSSYNSAGGYTEVTVEWDSDELESESGIRVWLGATPVDHGGWPSGALTGQDLDLSATISNATIKNYAETRVTLSISSGVVEWNIANGNAGYLELSENVTSFSISNWPASPNAGSFTLWVQQDETGGRTVTGWPSSVRWLGGSAPSITPDAYAVDVISFMTLDGGANIVGVAGQGALFAGLIGA